MELAPNTAYHAHKHEAPEIRIIVSGKAKWAFDGVTREVRRGSATYAKAGAVYKIVNETGGSLKAIWFWWGPDGEREVFNDDYEFIEAAPHKSGFFHEGASERVY